MVDKHLTTKVMPKKLTVLAEIAAALVTGAATLLWLAVGIYGFFADGFHWAHVFVFLFALPWILVLFLVLRRWYDRSCAKRIVSLLCSTETGVMTCGELSKAGVYAPAKAIVKLTKRKYIRNIVEVHGEVRLANRDLKQAVCAYCGASLLFRSESLSKCPNCGASAIKC